MLPFNVVGSAVGVILYVMFPEVILVSVLTLFLLYLFIGTCKKNVHVYHVEQEKLKTNIKVENEPASNQNNLEDEVEGGSPKPQQ